MFKKQLLNAVPREDWVEWVNFSGKSNWNTLREGYLLKARAAVFNDEMDISSKKGAALETRSTAFDSKKQKLVNNVANWENETSNLKKQIHDIKAKYGHFRGGKYTQLVDFSLADKQALRQLLKEGDGLEYQRRVITTSQKDLVYEMLQSGKKTEMNLLQIGAGMLKMVFLTRRLTLLKLRWSGMKV